MKNTCVAAILCILTLISTRANAADIIKQDPNVIPRTTTTSKTDSDERLLKEITYTVTNCRLHKLLSDICARTGVVINCGSSENDWQVRDIPVTVCVKNMPLGTLLRAIADSTHLHFSSNRSNDAWTYRIWRDLSRKKVLEEFIQAREEAANAAVAWDWNFWVKVKDAQVPEIIRAKPPYFAECRAEEVKALSRIINELGEESIHRVMNGDVIRLSLADSPVAVREDLLQLFRNLQTWTGSGDGIKKSGEPLSDLEIEQTCCLIVSKSRFVDRYPDDLSITVRKLHSPMYNSRGAVKEFSVAPLVGALQKQGVELTARPVAPIAPELDNLPSNYVRLEWSKNKAGFPGLTSKVKLRVLAKDEKPTFCNLISALSEQCEFGIIAEDFQSNKSIDEFKFNYSKMFDREITIADILIAANHNVDWWLDEKNGFLVGRAKDWTQRHINLVPAEIVDSLQEKLDGEGVDLDDMMQIAPLTSGQKFEWFSIADFPRALQVNDITLPHATLWNYYASLTLEQRKLAKSDKGFMVPEQDVALITEVLRKRHAALLSSLPAAAGEGPMLFPMYKGDFANLDGLNDLVLKVTRSQIHSTTKNSWRICLQATREQKEIVTSNEIAGLPIYSVSREAELAKQKRQ